MSSNDNGPIEQKQNTYISDNLIENLSVSQMFSKLVHKQPYRTL